jgi:hypothetical protein
LGNAWKHWYDSRDTPQAKQAVLMRELWFIIVIMSRRRLLVTIAAGVICSAVSGCGGSTPRVAEGPAGHSSTVTATPTRASSTPTTPSPIPPPPMPSLPANDIQTGIVDFGPQISSTRWQQVNGWVRAVSPTTELSVWAGGATINPSVTNPPSLAAVLVITPSDYATTVAEHRSLQDLGTIYYPTGHPMGRLKVTAANGNILTVSLVGTARTYHFNVAADTFS